MKTYTLKVVASLFVIGSLFFAAPLKAQDPAGKVAELAGKVLVTHDGAKSCDLADQSPIFLKDIVETKKEGSVKLTLKDGSDFVLRENTKVIVSEFLLDTKKNRRQTVLDVSLGKVLATVTKTFNKAISKTELKTPTAVVGVRGTEFAVHVTPKKTIVYCLKGLVQTFNPLYPASTVAVAAGMATDVVAGMIPNIPNPIPPEILDQLENQFGFPLTTEGLKQRGKDELQNHLPFPL